MQTTFETGNAASAARDLRRWVYVLLITVVAALHVQRIGLTTNLYSPAQWPRSRPVHSPMQSANDRSRWCTVWALVERGTYRIDEIIQRPGWDTIDKVQLDGHFYSSKPPLLPTLLAGLYWAIKQTLGWDLVTNTHQVVHLILILINVVPHLIALAVLAALLEQYAQRDFTRMFVFVSAAFGTYWSTYQTTLSNHTPAICTMMFSLAPWLRVVVDGDRRLRNYLLAGFWSGATFANELPALLWVAIAGLGLAASEFSFLRAHASPVRSELRGSLARLGVFTAALAVPMAAWFLSNGIVTGSWKPFYASFTSELYRYEGSYWNNPKGIDKVVDTPATYLFHCLIGHHGIFSLTPVFLLTLAGWCGPAWRKDERLRPLHAAALILTAGVLAFFLTRTESYNYGGRASGLRWMFWLIPTWLLGIVPALDAWGGRRGVRLAAAAFLAGSVASVVYAFSNPWQFPWFYVWWKVWFPDPQP